MKILFLGDIFGKPGRRAVKELLPELRNDADLVIANVENSHHGKGVSDAKFQELLEAGIDFGTSGNHIWKVAEICEYLDKPDYPLIRPLNYPQGVPGRGFGEIEIGAGKVLIVNLMGRVFMPSHLDCPFRAIDKLLKDKVLGRDYVSIIVDFHAEAGSEKVAMANYLDGRVSAVLGTHTHIATADERILENGTAFQADVGFCGPAHSIIGLEKADIIKQFLTQMPVKHQIAGGQAMLNGTLIEVDLKSGHAKSIKRIAKLTN